MRPTLSLMILFVFASCTRVSNSKLHYYSFDRSLSPVEYSASPRVKLGVGPIQMAEHLDRPNLVKRDEKDRLLIYNLHRWAAPLDDYLKASLSHELQVLDPQVQIRSHPWYKPASLDYQLLIFIERFEALDSGEVLLLGRYQLFKLVSDEIVADEEVELSMPYEPDSFQSYVKTLQKLSAQFAKEIHKDIRQKINYPRSPLSAPLSAERP